MEKFFLLIAIVAIEFVVKNLVVIKKLLREELKTSDIAFNILNIAMSIVLISVDAHWIMPLVFGGLFTAFQLLSICKGNSGTYTPEKSFLKEVLLNIVAAGAFVLLVIMLTSSSILVSGYCYYKMKQSEKAFEKVWQNTPAIVVEYDDYIIDDSKVINDSIAISAKADFRVLKLQKGDSIKYLKQDIEYGLPVERFEIITIGGEKVTESLPCPIL